MNKTNINIHNTKTLYIVLTSPSRWATKCYTKNGSLVPNSCSLFWLDCVDTNMEITKHAISQAEASRKTPKEAGFQGKFLQISVWRLERDVPSHSSSHVQTHQL